jgi:mannose-6-phosphate isomerase-like protein (cupin superfamily)
MGRWLDHVESAYSRPSHEDADRAQYLIRHGTMRAGLYAPRCDDQGPHAQDELYIVRAGGALFRRNDETVEVETGHLIFVPAGASHRFERTSEDFATYVVFWGPNHGETDQ